LATVYKVWRREVREDPDQWAIVNDTAQKIEKIPHIEKFLWPQAGLDWLEVFGEIDLTLETQESLAAFREQVQIWQGTVLLPVDQIILTLAQDLFFDSTELAIAHKLATLLRQTENSHPEWRLNELSGELAVIARNERRFLGFSADDTGFDPDSHKGEVTISTVHKAKGLEWDRVYLLAVNNFNYPSGDEYDQYIPERWFIRDRLNLEAETLEQLKFAFTKKQNEWYLEGEASQSAREEYIRERLRLLYVGITRAREELIITWNTGQRNKSFPAVPFLALQSFGDTES
jgi:DNA helicase-2/ATP-dependent DNA helicase PcrA